MKANQCALHVENNMGYCRPKCQHPIRMRWSLLSLILLQFAFEKEKDVYDERVAKLIQVVLPDLGEVQTANAFATSVCHTATRLPAGILKTA